MQQKHTFLMNKEYSLYPSLLSNGYHRYRSDTVENSHFICFFVIDAKDCVDCFEKTNKALLKLRKEIVNIQDIPARQPNKGVLHRIHTRMIMYWVTRDKVKED